VREAAKNLFAHTGYTLNYARTKGEHFSRSRGSRRDKMKVALAWAFASAAFGALFSAIVHERIAASDVGSEPKGRQLQDDNEVEEDDDQISFQLKMYWEEGYRYVNY
jgi:hypothetical protein